MPRQVRVDELGRYLCLHNNFDLPFRYVSFVRPLKKEGKSWDEIGPDERKFVDAVLRLDGIIKVAFQPYEISIEKGEIYSWSDLRPRILRILKRVYKRPEVMQATEGQPAV